ncbi:uncharacterized protein [Ptychodera flava]|uniref:uncharacterized protein n=1 Tax=Ptychodera flava TaxID=63121 RepID=UPI003969D605
MANILMLLVCSAVLLIGTSLTCVVVGPVKTFLERASDTDIIIYGEPVAKYTREDVPAGLSSPSAYIAEFVVYCILKGELMSARENVTGLGMMMSCDVTTVDLGQKYVIFLQRSGGYLLPDHHNVQNAATVATTEIFAQLSTLCELTPRPPTGQEVCPPEVPSANAKPAHCERAVIIPTVVTDNTGKFSTETSNFPLSASVLKTVERRQVTTKRTKTDKNIKTVTAKPEKNRKPTESPKLTTSKPNVTPKLGHARSNAFANCKDSVTIVTVLLVYWYTM